MMFRHRTLVNWQILLDDDRWNGDQAPKIPRDPPALAHPYRPFLLLGAVGVLSLAVMVAGFLLWQKAEAGLEQIEAELQEALTLESWMSTRTASTDQSSIPAAGFTLQNFDLRGDLARTEVIVTDPSLPLPYRETRCYQQTDATWERTSPASIFWGSQHILESEHFVFHFHLHDATAVAEASPILNALYLHLSQMLGLPTAGQDRLIVDVAADPHLSVFRRLHVIENEIRVLSPSLLQIPLTSSPAEALVQAVSIPLLHYLVDQTTSEWIRDVDWPLNWRWEPIYEGIELWLFWESGGPLTQWRSEIMNWFYRKPGGRRLSPKQSLPEGFQEFCQLCNMIGISPLDLALPLSCTADFSIDGITFRFVPPMPTRLADLVHPLPCLADIESQGAASMSFRIFLSQIVASSTLIDYAVDTYGQERLPLLLNLLDTETGWETLISTVFGVSANEFEAGWQVYLEDQYREKEATPDLDADLPSTSSEKLLIYFALPDAAGR
jgi:hypothetical protein